MNIQEHLTREDILWVEQTISKFSDKFLAIRERTVGKIPSGAIDGVYDDKLAEQGHLGQTKTFWTNGFWAGILWQLYSVTKDERYAEIARHTEDVLHSCLSEATGLATHDIGYLFLPSAVLDYKLTGDKDALNDATVAITCWRAASTRRAISSGPGAEKSCPVLLPVTLRCTPPG